MHGEEALLYDATPDDAERDRIDRAAAACPVQAIIVEAPTPPIPAQPTTRTEVAAESRETVGRHAR